MKCRDCGKRLSRIGRWINHLLGKKVYTLTIVDEENNIRTSGVVCNTCGRFYEAFLQLANLIGEEEVLKLLDAKLKEE